METTTERFNRLFSIVKLWLGFPKSDSIENL